jgi:hypothetical protein
MVDFSRYVPPGVYVDTSQILPIVPPGIDPSIVCLIGPAVGYHVYTETISFASGNTVVLTQKGINPTSLVVQGNTTDPSATGQTLYTTFVADVSGTPNDYSTTVDTSGGTGNSVTTLVRTLTGDIETEHPEVTVTYQYTDADYHKLTPVEDFDTFCDLYGAPYDNDTGAIVSPLSLAAYYAMLNGSNALYAVALDGVGSLAQQFYNAYQKLAGNYQANVVVPIWNGAQDKTTIMGMLQSLKGLIEQDARDGFLRVAVVGIDKDYRPTPTDIKQVATTTSSSRIILPWPNRMEAFNTVTSQSQILDGWYMAAALAGQIVQRPSQMPLTRKFPIGFLGIPADVQKVLTKSVLNSMAASGLCLLEHDRNGRLRVRHGLTTDYTGGLMTREISLLRAMDTLYYLIQDTLDNAGLIGTPIEADTPLRVKSVASGGLEYAKIRGTIVDYNNLKVRQQQPPEGDPTVIEVRFAYKPAWPLNYILVSFTVDTSTGDSSITTLALTNSAAVGSGSF